MRTQVLLLSIAAAATLDLCVGVSYQETGDCKATHENLYKYSATEKYFGEEMNQTFEIIIHIKVYCKSVGMYGDKKAKLYDLKITEAKLGGSIIERRKKDHVESDGAEQDFKEKLEGWFRFVQTEDGSIPVTLFSREEDHEIVNIKKAVVSAFQANFKGTAVKEEADPQSLHKAEYSYEASLHDLKEGVLHMHRKITSEDVEGYASHVPGKEVDMEKDEDLVYKKGVLTHASGTVSCKLMTQENNSPSDDVEEDILEAEGKRKRDATGPADPDDIKTYDPDMKTNHYESKGSYKVDLVGQRRLLRHRRNADHVDLSNAVVSTLLSFINQTRKAMERMMDLYRELGDITQALDDLHENPNNTDIAHKIEALVKLEAEYGPLPEFSPAVDDVLEYLKPLLGSSSKRDIKMRFLIYFIISPEGSLPSQLALLEGFERAVNGEEIETVIIYIALVENPQPQFVAKLEKLMSSDVHSGDPLLLAYGAIIPRASPDLQQRMMLFLINRLPQAETNSTSLIHHILSLGNSASPRITSFLIDYLGHSEKDVQLTSIMAMRFLMNEPSIQKSLKELLIQPHATEDHLTMIAKALFYGTEEAKLNHQEKPFSNDFAKALVISSINTDNEELHTAITTYLQAINTEDSLDLLKFLTFAKSTNYEEQYTNTTRFQRGTRWDENNAVYNLVAPIAERQNDVRKYQNRLSYIWGKRFGGRDINVEVAAGGFAGVSISGSYKLFGHAVAKAKCYNRRYTFLDFLALRKKEPSSTLTRLYANVMGKTLKNVYLSEAAEVCKTHQESLYEGKQYTIFDFTYSIFVVVGTLNFRLTATAQFTTGMYARFCDNHGNIAVGAGLTPTLTLKVSASGDLEIVWVAKAGLTLEATFNYQVLPEVTSEFCYKQSQIRVKNCIGVYDQWTDNKLNLYAWYAWRGWCGWWACTGSRAYRNRKKINGLSKTWNLPGTRRRTLLKKCDRDYTC